VHPQGVNDLLALIIVKEAETGIRAINRGQRRVQDHIVKDEILDRLVLPLLMQFDVRVQLRDGQKVRDHTSVEPEVSMMIMPSNLNDDLVCVPNYDTEELLPILIVLGVCPLWFQSAFKFHAEIHVTSQDEFSFWLCIPQLLLDPLKLIF
jgi:hypothetical protein